MSAVANDLSVSRRDIGRASFLDSVIVMNRRWWLVALVMLLSWRRLPIISRLAVVLLWSRGGIAFMNVEASVTIFALAPCVVPTDLLRLGLGRRDDLDGNVFGDRGRVTVLQLMESVEALYIGPVSLAGGCQRGYYS